VTSEETGVSFLNYLTRVKNLLGPASSNNPGCILSSEQDYLMSFEAKGFSHDHSSYPTSKGEGERCGQIMKQPSI
jgi:hypothetical protein